MTDVAAITLDDLSINLPVVRYQDQPVVTTELLARLFGTEQGNIQRNFSNNRSRFEPGKHFFMLEGEDLRDFKELHCQKNIHSVKIALQTRVLTLWTKRGAARHSKMLGTDQAWEMFDQLEEAYFSPQPRTESEQIEQLRQFALAQNPVYRILYQHRLANLPVLHSAKILECCETTVRRYLKDMELHGLLPEPLVEPLSTRPHTERDAWRWLDMRTRGIPVNDIAAIERRSASTIRRALDRFNGNQGDLFGPQGGAA